MYFDGAGQEYTDETLRIAIERAKEVGLSLVIASNTGDTVFRALELGAGGLDIVCVTHMTGFRNPGENELEESKRAELIERSVKVLTTTHVLAGVDRALRTQFGGIYPPEIIASTLRMFGQGTKVCVEIAIMALDAGLIEYGKPIVAVGGSGRGADTALVLTPAHSNKVFELKIHEILVKPANW